MTVWKGAKDVIKKIIGSVPSSAITKSNKGAKVSLMVTSSQKKELTERLEWSPSEVRLLKPSQAHSLLQGGLTRPTKLTPFNVNEIEEFINKLPPPTKEEIQVRAMPSVARPQLVLCLTSRLSPSPRSSIKRNSLPPRLLTSLISQ